MFDPNPQVVVADRDLVEVDGHPMSHTMFNAFPARSFSPELRALFVRRFAASHNSCHCGGAANACVNGEWLCFDHGGDA